MHLTDRPLVEVALLLIGLSHTSFETKTSFGLLERDQLSFRLSALESIGNSSLPPIPPPLAEVGDRDDIPLLLEGKK
jgi:hypothetical protein